MAQFFMVFGVVAFFLVVAAALMILGVVVDHFLHTTRIYTALFGDDE